MNRKRTAIIFTANTPHVAQANLMLDSLQAADKGNFQGDIWVISTGLSSRAKNFLDCRNVKYLISTMDSLYQWDNWETIAKTQPEYNGFLKSQSPSKALISAFEAYRNKRMSKLILLDWVRKFGKNYDFIALGDNDLYFQQDVGELFERAYTVGPDQIHYWQEEHRINPGSALWKKNFHYMRCQGTAPLDFGEHEINIGFILGKPDTLYHVFSRVKTLFFHLLCDMITKFQWHDQDLVRLVRAQSPELFRLLEEGDIVHLCNGGELVVDERFPREFYHKKTGGKPVVIHFAGGAWKKYPSVKDTYTVDPNTYYFDNEMTPLYDKILSLSRINLYNDVTQKYFTQENLESRQSARKSWLRLLGSSKKKVLFIGWLRTNIHKSTYNAIPEFFHNQDIDLAVLNGNVTKEKYDDIISEDFPLILAELTRVVKDPFLVRVFGAPLPSVPDWIFADCEKGAIAEYDCSPRAARALANMVYLFFSEALDFYSPNVVCLWGLLSPLGKMVKNICAWKGLPVCSLEWGILPGTVSYDFCGHMGESWVTRNADFFNSLPVDESDCQKAQAYLDIAQDPELSRNTPKELSPDVVERLSQLKREGKNIVLYMESNSAHSGNTLADVEIAKLHSPFFQDDADAYDAVLRVCKKHDWHILYKPHPISLTRGIRTQIDADCTTVLYCGGLSEAVSYSNCSLTLVSQGAYISLIQKVPTIMLGINQLNGSGAAYVLDKEEHLEQLLVTALEDGYTLKQQECFQKHVSRALKYYVYSAHKKVSAQPSASISADLLAIMDGTQPDHRKFEREAYLKQLQSGKKPCIAATEQSPMVSIIMPVYNSEEYLAACIDSILNQTLVSFELICINNGSQDDSQAILEYYAHRDPRISLHWQDEPNQRIARNWGIEHAKGKYIYLIDSDDYLDREALEELTLIAEEKHADAVYFFFREVRTDMELVRPRPRYFTYRRFFPDDSVFALNKEYHKFFIQYPFPWAKLLRADFVRDNALFFDKDCSNFDDNPHNLRVLLGAKNAYVYNKAMYNFRIHRKSMTQSSNPRIAGMIDAVRIMNDIYRQHGCYSEYQKWYVPYKIHLLTFAWSLLPADLKKTYYESLKDLFIESDLLYFNNDEVWSFFESPTPDSVKLMRGMLSLPYKQFLKQEQKGEHNHQSSLKDNVKVMLASTPRLYNFARKAYWRVKYGVATP